MPNGNHFFPVYLLREGPPGESERPWAHVLVEILFRAGQKSIRIQAALVAHEAGRRKWNDAVRPPTELVPRPWTCDPEPMAEPAFGPAVCEVD